MTDKRVSSAPSHLSPFSVAPLPAVIHYEDNCSTLRHFKLFCVDISESVPAIFSCGPTLGHSRHTVLVMNWDRGPTLQGWWKFFYFRPFVWLKLCKKKKKMEINTGHWPAPQFGIDPSISTSGVYSKATNVVCYWFCSFKPGWIWLQCSIICHVCQMAPYSFLYVVFLLPHFKHSKYMWQLVSMCKTKRYASEKPPTRKRHCVYLFYLESATVLQLF